RAYTVQTTSGGRELHFTEMPQTLELAAAGSADLGPDLPLDAARAASKAWIDVTDCDAAFYVTTALLGTADAFANGGLPGTDGHHSLVWVESHWIEDPALLAITYTYYSDLTGHIHEDDLVMNGADYVWSVSGAPGAIDAPSIVTHEMGHAFGLGHSTDPEATMYALTAPGETKKRDLADDDLAGIRHLYPPGCCAKTATRDLFARLGCEVAPSQGSALALGTLAVAAVALARRRRKALAIAVALPLLASADVEATVARALSLEEMTRGASLVV